jgi:hypothetical protein
MKEFTERVRSAEAASIEGFSALARAMQPLKLQTNQQTNSRGDWN